MRDFEVPVGWQVKRLGDIAKVRSGVTKNTKRELDKPIDVPYLRVANVQDGFLDLTEIKTIKVPTEQLSRFLLKPGDVLMNEGGDIDKLGRGAVWNGEISPCVHQNHVFSVRCNLEQILPRHLAAVAESPIGKSYFRIVGKQTTNLASINKTLLRNFPIPIPPLPEQRKIAAILSSVDDTIQATQAVIDQTRRVKEGLLQDLLTKGIGHTRFKKTPIGEVPEGWDIDVVENFANISTGNKDTKDREPDGEYPFFVRSQTVERINSFSFDGEAVLTAGDGVGTGKVFHYINGRFDYHQRVYNISDFSGEVLGRFFFYYFQTFFIDQVRLYSAKNSVDSVRRAMIAKMPIPLPPLHEQKEITTILSSVDATIRENEARLAQLQQVKAGLLQDLLTGKVRVTP